MELLAITLKLYTESFDTHFSDFFSKDLAELSTDFIEYKKEVNNMVPKFSQTILVSFVRF